MFKVETLLPTVCSGVKKLEKEMVVEQSLANDRGIATRTTEGEAVRGSPELQSEERVLQSRQYLEEIWVHNLGQGCMIL